MLNVQKMIASAEEALGWPYVSPGSNDASGIDCSGLFVKIYRDQGASIYHGSNRIYRKYCKEKGQIRSVSDLQPGMAVFKWKDRTPKGYNDDLGDFHHIGLVVSAKPLRIIHASSAKGKVVTDTKLGQWSHWGMLSDVAYQTSDRSDIEMPEEVNEVLAVVTAESGSSVKMRAKPSTSSGVYWDIPVGATVILLEREEDWSHIRYGTKTGYMMTKFLQVQGEAKAELIVEKQRLADAYALLENALKAFIVPKSDVEKAYDIIGDMLGLRG